MVHNGIEPNDNYGLQSFFHLEIPIKYQHLISITILTPTCGFLDTIIGVDQRYHAFTYTPFQDWLT